MQTSDTDRSALLEPEEVSQHEIELILLRHLASYLTMPIFIADNNGNIIYFNEPAEVIIGRRFERIETLPLASTFEAFHANDNSRPIAPDETPMAIALREQRPVHKGVRLRGSDGALHDVEITAFPLVGQVGRRLGIVALFWELEGEPEVRANP